MFQEKEIKGMERSKEYLKRAKEIIPSCSQTFSKGPSQWVGGVSPYALEKGKGSHVWDVDGNEYIDYVLALGPVVLGYTYPKIDRAIKEQLKKGISFSLPHRLEIEVAELLAEVIPCAEMVRFGKNGSDVTTGAIRVARAYTGRDKVAVCGYHGWHDWYISTTTRDKGIPIFNKELALKFKYNDIESLEKIFEENPGQIAAVIMEGIDSEEPQDGFLEKVRALTEKQGTLLIFDEIVNGFRIAIGGAHDYYKIRPDLATFGKAMANGMPLSAVVGRRDVMKVFDDVFYSFTFGGEALSLAAAKATVQEIRAKSVIATIASNGQKLKNGVKGLIKKYQLDDLVECVGLDAHSKIKFKELIPAGPFYVKSLFQQEMVGRGILHFGVNNFCYSHSTKDILTTLNACAAAFAKIKEAKSNGNTVGDYKKLLRGEPICPVFQVR